MSTKTATRHVAKAHSEATYDSRPAARHAYTRAVRRSAAAEIADGLDEYNEAA